MRQDYGMKFTFQYEEGLPKIEICVEKDANISKVINAFSSFLLAVGYHPENVEEELGDFRDDE